MATNVSWYQEFWETNFPPIIPPPPNERTSSLKFKPFFQGNNFLSTRRCSGSNVICLSVSLHPRKKVENGSSHEVTRAGRRKESSWPVPRGGERKMKKAHILGRGSRRLTVQAVEHSQEPGDPSFPVTSMVCVYVRV